MSKFLIPNNERKFSQVNDGDVAGNIWLSQNLDLKSNKGKIRVSPRLIVNTTVDGTSYFTGVSAFARYQVAKDGESTGYWCQVGTTLYKTIDASGDPTVAFTQDAITSSPVDLDYLISDMIVAPNGLLVSTHDDVYLWNYTTTAWVSWFKTTLSKTFTDTIGSHCLENIPYTSSKSIVISDGNTIRTVGSPWTSGGSVILTLDTSQKVLWIKSGSTRVWIGTINTSGGEGLVYEWDGVNTTWARTYKVGATGALAGLIKDDIPWIMTSDGSLKYFNGSAFVTATQLPHTVTTSMLLNSTLSTPANGNNRWIHPNGMKLIDGNINILINNLIEGTNYTTANCIENEPSGIWEYDSDIGFVHKYSATLDATGDLDSGQNVIYYAGALFETKALQASLLAGIVVAKTASTLRYAIYNDEIDNTLAKVGVMVTPWLQSFEIEDVWQKLWLKFKDLDSATDEIIVKSRTRKDKNLPAIYSATYTSTTTFTITSTTNLLTDTNILKVGNEVELIMASGAGKSAHISSVEVAGTYTYTITIDEAICPASGTGKVRFNNWTKLATISTQTITDQVLALGKTSTELQIKLELRGTGNNPEINQLVALSTTQLPIK